MTAHQTIDPDTYSVYDYQDGRQLTGAPTVALVRASLAAGDTGAVGAMYDRDAATWDLLRGDEMDHYRARGESVRTVYVMED